MSQDKTNKNYYKLIPDIGWFFEKKCVKYCKNIKFTVYIGYMLQEQIRTLNGEYKFGETTIKNNSLIFPKAIYNNSKCMFKATRNEIGENTCLTNRDQLNARIYWEKQGILNVERKGIAGNNYYYIDINKYIDKVYPDLKK